MGLDDLAAAFQLAVREEAGALTVSYKGRTIVLTPDQALASVGGRLASLAAAPIRTSGGRWLVPLDFISRALTLIYDTRLDLRRPSRLLVIGDLRVPRVTARYEALGNTGRLTIDAAPRAAATVSQEADRLNVKFDADAIDPAIAPLQPQALVAAVRATDATTVAVDLGPRFATFRASIETIDTTTRTVIELAGKPTEPSAAPPPAPPPTEPPPLTAPAASIRTVVVDPGHGGTDEGSRGPGGSVEKNVTLALARRLKAAIEVRLGIRVLLTRDEDQNPALDERAAIANSNRADFFISLHANASFRSSSSGASVYVASFDDPSAPAALKPARVPTFGGGSRDIELVPWNLAQIRYIDRSMQAARIVEHQFQDRIPLDRRAVDRAPLRVLQSANMPAVLVELGYLTNADQEKQLVGGDFQTLIVQALFDSIAKFRDALSSGSVQ